MSEENPTESLDADQFVDNGVPLAVREPLPQQVHVHWDIQDCLHQEYGEHYITVNFI